MGASTPATTAAGAGDNFRPDMAAVGFTASQRKAVALLPSFPLTAALSRRLLPHATCACPRPREPTTLLHMRTFRDCPRQCALACTKLAQPCYQHMHNNTQTCAGTYTHHRRRAQTQASSTRMNTQVATKLRARCVNSTRRMPSCICKRFCHALGHTNGEADGCRRRWR